MSTDTSVADFRAAVIEELRHDSSVAPNSWTSFNAARNLALLERATEPKPDIELQTLSMTQFHKHKRLYTDRKTPIVMRGEPVVAWGKESEPIDQILDTWAKAPKTAVSVNIGSASREDSSVETRTYKTVVERFRRAATRRDHPWNVLDSAVPTKFRDRVKIPWQGDDACLSNILNSSITSHAPGARDSKLLWMLLAQGGAQSTAHVDAYGCSTWLSVQQGEIGFGWMVSEKDRKPWEKDSQNFSGGQWRYAVLGQNDTILFPAGTIHFVFRRRSLDSLVFGGHVLLWSQLVHWAKAMIRQVDHPATTNELIDALQVRVYMEEAVLLLNQGAHIADDAQVKEFRGLLHSFIRSNSRNRKPEATASKLAALANKLASPADTAIPPTGVASIRRSSRHPFPSPARTTSSSGSSDSHGPAPYDNGPAFQRMHQETAPNQSYRTALGEKYTGARFQVLTQLETAEDSPTTRRQPARSIKRSPRFPEIGTASKIFSPLVAQHSTDGADETSKQDRGFGHGRFGLAQDFGATDDDDDDDADQDGVHPRRLRSTKDGGATKNHADLDGVHPRRLRSTKAIEASDDDTDLDGIRPRRLRSTKAIGASDDDTDQDSIHPRLLHSRATNGDADEDDVLDPVTSEDDGAAIGNSNQDITKAANGDADEKDALNPPETLDCFKDGRHLTDEAMSQAFTLLTCHESSVTVVDPWTNDASILDDSSKIVQSLFHSGHWTLLVVDLPLKHIAFFNSLPTNPKLKDTVDDHVFSHLLPEESRDDWIFTTCLTPPQSHPTDCGVFVLATLAYTMTGLPLPAKLYPPVWRAALSLLLLGRLVEEPPFHSLLPLSAAKRTRRSTAATGGGEAVAKELESVVGMHEDAEELRRIITCITDKAIAASGALERELAEHAKVMEAYETLIQLQKTTRGADFSQELDRQCQERREQNRKCEARLRGVEKLKSNGPKAVEYCEQTAEKAAAKVRSLTQQMEVLGA